MTTVCESDFTAAFDYKLLNLSQLTTKDIANNNFITKGNYKVQPTRMKSNRQTFLSKWDRADLQVALLVIPYADSLVFGASSDQLLPDADIKASDCIIMEGANDVLELRVALLVVLHL